VLLEELDVVGSEFLSLGNLEWG
jgi:hypothetical protein